MLFGQYPQTAQGEGKPICWRVLGKYSGDTFLLQSEYILEYAPISHQPVKKWWGSPIDSFLNSQKEGGFLGTAFSPAERQAIFRREAYSSLFVIHVDNFNNNRQGLMQKENRTALPTDYVKSKYHLTDPGQNFYWVRQLNSATHWETYLIIDSEGKVLETQAYDSYGGVRPAMYLNCLGLFNAGTGSKEDPFRRE